MMFMAVIDLLPTAALANRHADQQITADALAQSTLETLRTANYATLTSGSIVQSINGTDYKIDTVVSAPPASVITTNVKRIVVTVSWDEPGAVSRSRPSISVQLYVCQTRP